MLDQEFWKKHFKVYDILNKSVPYQEVMDEIIKETGIKNNDIVMDAGCGTGNFELRLRKKQPGLKAKIIGLANSPDGLEIYQKKIKNARTVLADLTERLPFEDNFFDKIISNNTLFTIGHEKRIDVLRELRRVLKPGGKIVVSNIKYEWSPYKIYLESIKAEFKRSSFLKAIVVFLKTLLPAIKLLSYNRIIVKEGFFGDYRCMDDNEQAKCLAKAGFKNISEDKHVYANQSILNSAEKIISIS